jgi:type VI secretion system lysozyme-like protein
MESRKQFHKLSWRPQLFPGLPVPLFDRFDEEIDDWRVLEPYLVQTLDLLRESIQKELSNLLNTRLPPRKPPQSGWSSVSEPETVLDYGVPALSSLESGSMTDHQLLRETILKKIRRFEPRLIDPHLELRSNPENPAAMLGFLRGKVILDSVMHPIDFSLKLDEHGESAAVVAGTAANDEDR